jgi:hypothetical protein
VNECKPLGGGAPVGSAPPADPLSSLAMLYTVASVTIPSLASVYNEFALKVGQCRLTLSSPR